MSQEITAELRSPEDLPLVVAVDLGGTQVRTAVLRGDRVLSRIGILTGENPTPERLIPRMFRAVEQAVDAAMVDLDQIVGIGIGAPGPLNHRSGVVFAPPNLPGWHNVPLQDLFAERFHLPIGIENDANAAALGEYMFGAGRGVRDLVYVTISTGIGGGVVSEGKLLRGVSGTAAELGHMTIDWRGERCNCGNIGCWERIASGTGIAHRANQAIALGKGEDLLAFALTHQEDKAANTPEDSAAEEALGSPVHVNAHMVALAAHDGVATAREIIRETAEAIGVGLVNIIHIFNPTIIILGGGVSQMGPMLFEPAQRVIGERAMRVPQEAVRIVPAQLGANVGLVGAGALMYYDED